MRLFPRRYGRHVRESVLGRNGIDVTEKKEAVQFAKEMRVNNKFPGGLYCFTDDRYTLHDFDEELIKTLAALKLKVIYFESSSNELSHFECTQRERTVNLFKEWSKFIKRLPAHKIMIGNVVPRAKFPKNSRCTRRIFRENMECYNIELQKFKENACLEGLHVTINKHEGFYRDAKDTRKPKDVYTWSIDGIHPAGDGMKKYRRNIVKCLLRDK